MSRSLTEMRPLTKAHFSVIGNHATSLPEEVLLASGLDSVIRREPELTAQDLVDAVERGRGLGEVLGISFKDKDGTIVNNEDRPFNENLDDLPFAARHLLDNAKYTLPVINEPYTLIITSRGMSLFLYLLYRPSILWEKTEIAKR